ncbi:hypothetical protein [Streptomyces spirodelae]|uniref:Uncharacterized protein n=1 Tax=Streptomyces spirodelae TaxID=2812904 RepID=A0ABS3WWE3_9ACTN|nr:hypothetical protein [Streptomyces spirodelae]MBO8187455.1 hypothetical protein [Streptomyces spirodelae]
MTYEACGCVCHRGLEGGRMWIYDREQTPMPAPGLRLLPWTTESGKPCYLSGDLDSTVSCYADELEEAQLADGDRALKHFLFVYGEHGDDEKAGGAPKELAVALSNVLRVADSRGARLPGNSGGAGITCVPKLRDKEDGPGPTDR